jgi:hypothetical protein
VTAPQPATPGSDSVREQIAEVLTAHDWAWDEIQDERRCACGFDAYEGMEVHHADVLVPLVDRLRAEAKAEALEEAAHTLDDNGDQMVEIALGGAPYVHRFLCDRAAAYRTNPSEEAHRGQ